MRRHSSIPKSLWLLIVALLSSGCGDPEKHADARRTSYEAYEKGLVAFSARDYGTASGLLSAAVGTGFLNADAYSNAATRLAVSYAAEKRFDEALALLNELDKGAPNFDEVYAARSYVLAKQGKVAESRAALAKARQFNRAVQEFKD